MVALPRGRRRHRQDCRRDKLRHDIIIVSPHAAGQSMKLILTYWRSRGDQRRDEDDQEYSGEHASCRRFQESSPFVQYVRSIIIDSSREQRQLCQ